MTAALPLAALAALAVATAILLERSGRAGYGWVAGSEFALIGVAMGPVGLDAISADLLEAVRPAELLAVAWLGLRFGLRVRPRALAGIAWRTRLASLFEPLVCLIVIRALLEGVIRSGVVDLDGPSAWAIAAVGSATTKATAAWARARLGAKGGVSDALEAVSTLDDAVLLGAVALLVPRIAPAPGLPAFIWAPAAATIVLGVGLGLVVTLLLGRGPFRGDLGWIALFGTCALATGLSASLGLAAVAVAALTGWIVGIASPHAEALEELTRTTERPAVLTLLLLGGASLTAGWTALALGSAAAVLRVLAKLFSGWVASPLLPVASRRGDLGTGLLGAGGMAFGVALPMAHILPASGADLLLSSAVAMALLGDFLGTPLLRALLSRAGEMAVQAEPAP